ncbi:uncharacterized protein [Montipora foliosa]|uniref:uncharacterized protein isoform X2 n=1 Tax=Montipora foliosa TaxID=591990 RepID=UPI0035F201C5
MSDPENPREDEGNARRSTRVFKIITRGTRRLQEGTEEAAISFKRFWQNHFPRDSARGIPIDITDAPDPDGITEAEEKIRNILNANINELSVDQIEDAITANNLCDCRNPITTAFEFVSHPLTFRLMKRRWKYGLHPRLVLRKGLRFLFYIFVILDTALTPVLLPFIAYTFYKDQVSQKENKVEWKEKKKKLRDMHHDYLTTPFVIFIKDKICQFVFIILHIRMCVLDSSVEPRIEEYLILVFYIGFLMSELQQYLTSQSRVYLRELDNVAKLIKDFTTRSSFLK